MSTRCQVFIIEKLKGKEERIGTLYHHFDGYPERMVPMLNEAIKKWQKEATRRPTDSYTLINYIVAEDPSGYMMEPIDGKIHFDLAYLYEVRVKSKGNNWEWTAQVKTIGTKGIKMRLR
jgi:hypothetical protein